MIKIYTLEQSNEWDKIVMSFCNHDVYYLSGYVKAFKIHGDGEPILIYFESKDSRGINVVIKRDISDCKYFSDNLQKGEYFDIVTPYGYGGWIFEGTQRDLLKQEYEDFCKKENIISEFVRFHPILQTYKGAETLYDEIDLGQTVYLNTESEEIIWQNIISKNRNMIRKAQKNGLQVFWGRDPEIIKPFMGIYNSTMDKDEATDYYYFGEEFYKSILDDLKQNAMWFYVKSGNEIAAIAIFMFCNGQMHYHLSASKREFQHLAPTNLLLYEAAVWASHNGYKTLHLGGGVGSSHDSLYKFKKAFNRADDAEFYIGKKIFDTEKYNELVSIREKDADFDKSVSFFPLYRG